MKTLMSVLMFTALLAAAPLRADAPAGDLAMHWDPGAEDCKAQPHAPLEAHQYDPGTWILREDLCSTWEAPFIYLLVGREKALLIDTGDVADPRAMPLALTVMGLLPGDPNSRLPLLVVHSHTHLDHRAGDPQFSKLHAVQLVPAQLPDVEKFFGFEHWPEGQAQIDLGGRIVDVLPAPGHNPAHVVYYDRDTGLLLTGDFLMPARLLVDDYSAYAASAARVAAFVKDRPVSHVLGGHVEMSRDGQLFDWQSTYHPDEHPLALSKQDVLALPAALAKFNGFYTDADGFVIEDSMHNLEAFAAAVLLLLGTMVYLLVRFIRRRRAARHAASSA